MKDRKKVREIRMKRLRQKGRIIQFKKEIYNSRKVGDRKKEKNEEGR